MDYKLIKFLKFLLIFICIFACLILYSRFIGTKGLKVNEYSIINKNIPQSFYGFKIIHISDIHYKVTTNKNDLKKIVKEINLLKPDIVIFSGDLLDKKIKYTNEDFNDLKNFLSEINYNIGKYFISGENDTDEHFEDIMLDSDFIDLNDSYRIIYNGDNEGILITGISSNYKKNHIKETIKQIDVKEDFNYSILILHEPDFISEIDISNYNLILAGHSFNGLVKIPYIGGIIKNKFSNIYYDKYYKVSDSLIYISGGIGTSNYKFRFLNKPSINLYRLRNV